MKELNAIITIAFRDFLKLLRDKPRIFAGLVFPLIFVGVLGKGLDASVGRNLPFDYLAFIFTGVFAQTLFQSSAAGVISLIRDREEDFAQEMFIAPVSRYSIIIGKILGETSVSFVQATGVVVFGVVLGVPLSISTMLLLVPVALAASLLGGAFGIFVLANLGSQQSVAQIFPFLIFPQIFLSGVFNPLRDMPWFLKVLSHITPLTYGVDLVRGVYYAGRPEYGEVVLLNPFVNLAIIIVLFGIFLFVGTALFVRKDRER